MLWAYFAFSQYLIIWSGNLPEEIGWYIGHALRWGAIIVTIGILHFAAPFLFLLVASIKRNPRKLVSDCGAVILVMRTVDLFVDAGARVSGSQMDLARRSRYLVLVVCGWRSLPGRRWANDR